MSNYILQLHSSTNLEFAVHAWAAAAGTAGSPVPVLVAAELLQRKDGDLMAAVVAGTAAAEAACHPDDPCRPRGLDVHIEGGVSTALVWRSERHDVTLLASRSRWTGSVTWSMRVTGPDPRGKRMLAALAAAWSWRDGDEETQQVLGEAAGLGISAGEFGDDIEPPPGWEDRAVERARDEGVIS